MHTYRQAGLPTKGRLPPVVAAPFAAATSSLEILPDFFFQGPCQLNKTQKPEDRCLMLKVIYSNLREM